MIKPNYFKCFSCKASECKHNCCIGWEINIDEKTIEKYKKAKCGFLKDVKNSINNSSFVLTQNKRCPFLNEDNLCKIIINSGEKSLCDICREHPRFYNFVAGRYEAGLGISCEEAAKLILEFDKKVKIKGVHMCTSFEDRNFLKLRKKIFKSLQNDRIPLSKRIEIFEDIYDYDFVKSYEMFINLEKLSDERDKYFERIKEGEIKCFDIIDNLKWQKAFENLLLYFVYRHFTSANIYKLKFALFCMQTIAIIFANSNENIETFIDIARVFSSEIEYSPENTEYILNFVMEN